MLELLFELLVSVAVCAVIAFFLFLGRAEDEVEPDDTGYPYDDPARARGVPRAGSSGKSQLAAGGHARAGNHARGALPQLWRRACRTLHLNQDHWDALCDLSNSAWTALIGPNSMLGRDRDDEASGAIAEILSRRSQLKAQRRPSAFDLAQAGESDAGGGGSRGSSHHSSPTDVPARGERGKPRTDPAPLITNGATESAQWLNTLARWLAVLVLGGGTTQPQVWVDRVQHLVVKGVGFANNKWNETVATRRRSAACRTRAPRHMRARREGLRPRQNKRPLLTFYHLALGRGTFMMYAYHGNTGGGGNLNASIITSPPSATAALDATQSGSAGVATGSVAGEPFHASNLSVGGPSVSGAVVGSPSSAGVGGASVSTGGGAGGAGGGVSSAAAAAAVSAAAFLGASIGRRFGVPVDFSPSLEGSTSTADAVAADGSPLNAAGAATMETASTTMPGGPAFGVVLPRIAGEIVSFECLQPTTTAAPARRASPTAARTETSSSNNSIYATNSSRPLRRRTDGAAQEVATVADARPMGAIGSHPSGAAGGQASRGPSPVRGSGGGGGAAAAPAPLVPAPATRSFMVPIVYEDHHFQLKLGCSLPVTSLLPGPLNLVLPSDLLTIDAAVDVRHIVFHGLVHVAFRGPVIEIAFPEAPRFTAVMSVANPYIPSLSAGLSGVPMSTLERLGFFSGAGTAPTRSPYTGPVSAAADALNSGSAPAGEVGGAALAGTGGGGGGGGAAMVGSGSSAGVAAGGARGSPSQTHLSGSAHTGLHDRNDKMQFVVLNAVRMAIGFMTYPRVLRGQAWSTVPPDDAPVLPPTVPKTAEGRTPANPAQDFSFLLDSDDEEAPPGFMKWGVATASIPLFAS